MVFKGSPQLQSGEFERLVEQHGGVTNAATSQDYTYYYITVAPQAFAAIAPWQIDLVLNASISDAAFERERLVILEEIRRAADNPRRRVFCEAMKTAFNQLPYRRPVLGTANVIEQLTPQQMKNYHRSWYQPQTITAVAVGNLPVEELMQVVATGFAKFETRPAPVFQPWPLEPPFPEIVRQEVIDESLMQARLVMLWRVPGMDQLEQTYPMDILARILGKGRTARLVQDLREDKGLVSSISVSNMTQARQGVFYISAQLPTKNLSVVESAIAQHIQKLQTEEVTVTELAQVQRQIINQFIFQNETPSSRAGLYGYYQAILSDLMPALTYPSQIQAVRIADLQAAARQHLAANAYGVVICKPSEH
jgi:predicted Zn-dependent peptidase